LAAENTKLKNKVQASTRPTGAPKEEENEEFTVNGVKWYYCGKYWSGTSLSPYSPACIISADGGQIATHATIIAKNSCYKLLHAGD